ncbi:alanine/glycine:cation symporter family protein [Stieleria varia]|uniref:Amino-acid carrier protein AlsT n=1 Tax=Stieleria varia TaxID=2528005 RepID=A0A5C6B7F7_9BACT|nr:sodium:alanine symporter family protein [Stieleria varia]TWU07993.1 Amino-acid carrier protein AlsT [Stieleria varia]
MKRTHAPLLAFHAGPTRKFSLAMLTLCLVLTSVSVGSNALLASPQAEPVATDSANQPDENAPQPQSGEAENLPEEPSSEPPADSTPEPEPTAFDRVDGWFGKYLVAPVAKVIFYDFGSGPKTETQTDADGNESKVVHPGWLRTDGAPDGVSIPFVVLWLLAGAMFLTLRMRFINFRGFWHAIQLTRGKYDTPGEPGEVSHFQALAAALSATVGLGNIAGVAIAIGTGGPGATVWIILIGLLGMTAKFSECTLGQLYRSNDDSGHVIGGPMRYLKYGLAEIGMGGLGRVLAVVFAVLCIGASFGGGNAFQVGQSLDAIRGTDPDGFLNTYPWVYGLIMVVAVGVVIIGGIKSIGAVAGRVVPFMCAAYVLAALFILVVNLDKIPAAIATIFDQAFTPDAAYGSFLGVMVIGIKRAVFSNEAGVGSAAIAHSAAKTDEPVSEGIVALLEPFIDTVVVCTITALVIVVTGVYADPAMASEIAGNQGASLTLQAFVVGGYDWFRYILYVAVVLFAYSTCISWSYYGERCWAQLFGARTSLVYKGLFLVFTLLGSIITRGNILDFSDLMILGMSFPNLLGVFLLSGVVKRKLDEYWGKYQRGELAMAEDA